MSCDHSVRANCKIFNKPIIVDANFVISLVNAIGKRVDIALNWRQQTAQFSDLLQKYLGKFCKCPCRERLLTTDRIMNQELDVRNINSSISRKSPFLSEFRRRFNLGIVGPFMQSIWRDLNAAIETIAVNNEEIRSLSNTLGPNHHLSEEDLSLIICAIKQATLERTVVVTADLNLEEHLKDAIAQGRIELPTGIFATDGLLPMEIHTFISLIHHCCEMSNEENYCIHV